MLAPYIADDLHNKEGVDIISLDTTPQQEKDLVDSISQQGSVYPGKCAVAVSHVLQTNEPFKDLPTFWRPVALERELQRIKNDWGRPRSSPDPFPIYPDGSEGWHFSCFGCSVMRGA